jgi:serine/threonine-protein kinase HipA
MQGPKVRFTYSEPWLGEKNSYPISQAWPLQPTAIPVKKKKLAMRIGGHYRLQEIQPRHFEKLATSCRYSPDALLAALSDLATRLPDEASTIMAERRNSSPGSQMLHLFLDGLASNCKSMLLRLGRGA